MIMTAPGPTPAPPAGNGLPPRAGRHPHMTQLERKIDQALTEAKAVRYPRSRELSLTITKLEEARMWERARQEPPPDTGPD